MGSSLHLAALLRHEPLALFIGEVNALTRGGFGCLAGRGLHVPKIPNLLLSSHSIPNGNFWEGNFG
jgi:hypothetical protein